MKRMVVMACGGGTAAASARLPVSGQKWVAHGTYAGYSLMVS